jgi:chromosome segregation protein
MILSKLHIFGFKSFGKKTELRFDGGITAIVGPNGCGKTNIVDALRWGLGEQKASVLRADRMENIIFGGAQSSRPLGMAEVSITFDNSQHILPIDYNEVTITRRLYRSGESEYLLNKTPVRLKDITDLIMDTGIGAEAYSVIELKMVEDILSEKTEDRRRLLEEAAGVTKYKHRLKAAERKLEATQSDLVRVNDITQEVDRSVKSLQRQVHRAQKFQTLQEEVKDLDLKRSRQIFAQIQSKIEPLKAEIQSLHRIKDGQSTEISKEEADLEALRLELTDKEKALVQAQEAFSGMTERIHRRESDIRVGKERMTSLQGRIERYAKEIEDLKKRLSDQTNHLEITNRDREALQVKITSTGRIFANKKKELEVFLQGLNLKRLELNQKKKEIITCFEEINRLNSEENQFRTRIDNNKGRLERLEEEDRAFAVSQKRTEEEIRTLEGECKTLHSKRHDTRHSLEQLNQEDDRLQKALESLKEQFYRDQGEQDLLQGRLKFLRQLMESREGMSDGAKKLLREPVDGLLGPAADLFEVKPEWRQAIEAGLGESSRYLVMETAAKAYGAIRKLKEIGGGRVTLVALDRLARLPESSSRPQAPANPGVVGWADSLVKAESVVQKLASFLLGDLLVVRDMETAREILDQSQGGFRVATVDGGFIAGDSLFCSGEHDEKDDGMVGRRQRIQELEEQIGQLRKRRSETESQIREKEERRKRIAAEKEPLQKTRESADGQIVEAEKKRAKVQFESQNSEQGLRRNSDEREKLLGEIEKGKQGLENLRPKMESVLERKELVETRTAQIQNEVEHLEEEERGLEEEVHRHNLAVVRLNGEAKNLDMDIERSQKLVSEIQATIKQRDEEILQAQSEIANQQKETSENEGALVKDFEEKNRLDQERQDRDSEYRKIREDLEAKEKEVRVVRKGREESSEKIHLIEMEIAELDHQAKSIADRVHEAYQVDLVRLSFDEEVDIALAEQSIGELKNKIKVLGPVNLVALQEYESEKNRLDFLLQQRDDLLAAETTLKDTIVKINETARSRFLEVFTAVRDNFQGIFGRFFQGGEADLRLAESEDPLEARIEIMARPAGKQLRALDLLSGGEKALTAISLLFSLYMVKPSPFCILDEIDAPLDDANVERFTRVLTEYAKKTQFVIVSHNKMTMKAAQALYGVTMEEEGVSKIVSVKFEEGRNA